MTKLNKHHIRYKLPEWTVEIPAYWHRAISILQRTKPTKERYAWLTAVMHAIADIWNQWRCELDTGEKPDGQES